MVGDARNVRHEKHDERPVTKEWHWHAELPIPNSPLFEWPPRPRAAFRWIAKSWLQISMTLFTLCTALLTVTYLQPSPERFANFQLGWIAQIYFRNLALIAVTAGGLHLYFHTFKLQGRRRKFMDQEFAKNRRTFTFGDQVLDNMFWSIASGVTIWTIYEVLYFWASNNKYIPTVSFSDNPVVLSFLFFLTPFWLSLHFYWAHRLLHWPRLYKAAHRIHHRNIATGPWSGFSMHPLEHALYLSSILIHIVVPSNPVLMLFHMHMQVLNPLASHSGFAELLVRDKAWLALGEFHHQLHHRYFECNYGTADVPWDKWFGSFHDGTPEATEKMRQRRRNRG